MKYKKKKVLHYSQDTQSAMELYYWLVYIFIFVLLSLSVSHDWSKCTWSKNHLILSTKAKRHASLSENFWSWLAHIGLNEESKQSNMEDEYHKNHTGSQICSQKNQEYCFSFIFPLDWIAMVGSDFPGSNLLHLPLTSSFHQTSLTFYRIQAGVHVGNTLFQWALLPHSLWTDPASLQLAVVCWN